tara:strand:- start:332 stop:907 length:576 start_codon:yes stop_codon:yes gene_type:complete
MSYVILIPGGFKPPTCAHYRMVKSYSNHPEVKKTYIVQTSHVRERFESHITKKVFDIYGGFSERVQYILAEEGTRGAIEKVHKLVNDPDFTSQFSADTIYALGVSSKEDDAKRVQNFLNYYEKRPSALQEGITIGPPPFVAKVIGDKEGDMSSSALRQALREGDMSLVMRYTRSLAAANFLRNFSISRSLK